VRLNKVAGRKARKTEEFDTASGQDLDDLGVEIIGSGPFDETHMLADAVAENLVEDIVFAGRDRRSAEPLSQLQVLAIRAALPAADRQLGVTRPDSRKFLRHTLGRDMLDDIEERPSGMSITPRASVTAAYRFVRSLVGLDREAAKQAFSEFLLNRKLTANQHEFLNMIITNS
jgi:hypothetical protein